MKAPSFQMSNEAIYFWIATLQNFLTGQIIMQVMNEPVVAQSMHPIQWVLLMMNAVLAGLVALKALGSRPSEPTVEPTKP